MSESFTPIYRLPTRLKRMRQAGILLGVMTVLLVILPLAAVFSAGRYGGTSQIPLPLIIAGGATAALLGTLARYKRPTSLYGPITVVSSTATLVYLLLLGHFASATYAGTVSGRDVTATVDYGSLVLLFAIVPALGIIGGILITFQDRLFPGKRLPKDYPAK